MTLENPDLKMIDSKAQARGEGSDRGQKLAGWKALLLGSGAVQEALATRQALYFVDGPKCRSTGRLVLGLRYQERLKSGDWGAVKTARFDPLGLDAFDDPADREILGLLYSPLNMAAQGRLSAVPELILEVDPVLTEFVIQRLSASGRFFGSVSAAEDPQSHDPIALGVEPWSFEIEIKDEPSGFRMEGILVKKSAGRREKIPMRGETSMALLNSGFFVRAGTIEPVKWNANFGLAKHLLLYSIFVPKSEEAELVTTLASHGELPPLRVPTSLQWPFKDVRPRAVARFGRGDDPNALYAFNCVIAYDDMEIDPSSPQKVLLDPANRLRIKRDSKAEKIYLSPLKGLYSPGKLKTEFVKPMDLPALLQPLLNQGWEIEIDRKPLESMTQLEGTLSKYEQDFVLQASFDFKGEKVTFREFFAACARGERFLALKQERLGFVSDEWLKKIDLLLRGAHLEKDGGLRFQKASVPLYRPVFDEMLGLKTDDETSRLFQGMVDLAETGVAEKPRELRATLRCYQGEGLFWLEKIAKSGFGGILADDMGLGKTIQVIAYLLRRATVPRTGPRPSLVILPKSLVFNWMAEIEKFGPRLRVLDFAGANRGMLKANDYDVVVTTYHVLKNELDRFERIEFDTIILDEAQAIKNAGSQVAQAVFKLKASHRFALSGTPIENSLADLFSLMRFANPGLIPSRLAASVGDGRGGSLSKEALERLSVAVSPFILRRTKKQVLTELPDKCEQVLVCELESEQKKMYDRLRKQYRDSLKKEIAEKGAGRAKMQVLEALLRLRQVSCHPGLIDEKLIDKPSAKFEMLLEHLEEIKASGHKALIFSQFTSLLALLKPQLKKAGIRFDYLDGQTRDRGAVVEKFNSDPETTAFLISLKAGGTGLNLTTASYVFLLDPWWNPAAEAQAIDRAYRMGQTQKVMAYRLIAKGTIEEKILRLQEQKRSLAEAVISEDQGLLRSLSVDDLEALFES